MSLLEIPHSNKLEYLVYLGLAAVWVQLLALLVYPEPSVAPPLFLPVGSSIVAALLFLGRIDRKIEDWLVGKVADESKGIATFMARTATFLRIWEWQRTNQSSFERQTELWISSIVKGEDLHDEVWMRKGIVFFAVATPAAVLIALTPLCTSLIATVVIICALGGLWKYRLSEFTDKTRTLVMFRYFQNLLQVTESLRLAAPTSDAGVSPQQPERVRWGRDTGKELRDYLLKHCETLSSTISRGEWQGFASSFKFLEELVETSTNAYFQSEAFDLAVIAFSEAISAQGSPNSELSMVRWSLIRGCFGRLSSGTGLRVKAGFAELLQQQDSSRGALTQFLRAVNVADLRLNIHGVLGPALAKTAAESLEHGFVRTIEGWFTKGLESLSNALSIISYMDAWTRERLFTAMDKSTHSKRCDAILQGLEAIPYHAKKAAFEALQVFLKEGGLTDDAITAVTWRVYDRDSFLDTLAMNLIGYVGHEMIRKRQVIDAVCWALRSGNDTLRVSAAFSLMKGLERIENTEEIRAELEKVFPVGDPYLEKLLTQIMMKLRGESEVGEFYLNLAFYRSSIERQVLIDSVGPNPCELLQSMKSLPCPSDSASALRNIAILSACDSEWKRAEEWSNLLADCFASTNEDMVRMAIAGLLLSLGSDKGFNSTAAENLIASVDSAKRQFLPIVSRIIGSYGSIAVDWLEEQLRKPSVLGATLSLHHIGPSPLVTPEVVRRIAERVSRTQPDVALVSILALTSLASTARLSPTVMDQLQKLLTEDPQSALAAPAIECLKAIGGPRAREVLFQVKSRLEYWWLRNLWTEAIQSLTEETSSSVLS